MKRALRKTDEEMAKPVTPQELQDWRRKNGLSQSQAAKFLGVKVRSIENWEHNLRKMRHPAAMRKLMQLAKPKKDRKSTRQRQPKQATLL